MRRRLFTIALVCWSAIALAADPRAEMVAALTAAIDTNPAPAALPATTATNVATPAASKVPPQANLGRAAAEQAQAGHDQLAASLAGQAQAAATSAAGQAQAAAAKERTAHNPHR